MQQTAISEIYIQGSVRKPIAFLWNALLAVLFLAPALAALATPWQALSVPFVPPILAALAGWALCTAAQRLKKLGWAVCLLPWPILLVLFGMEESWNGLLFWFNALLSRWNQLHQGGLSLFAVNGDGQSILAISVLAAFFLGQLVQLLVNRRKLLLSGILVGLLLLLQLMLSTVSPWICGLLLSAFLGLWVSRKELSPSGSAVRIWLLGTILACFCAAMLPQTELSYVTDLREQVKQTIHAARYGEDLLPQGNLSLASQLNQGKTEILQVETQQDKALYLRGFVGAEYADGVWQPLPDSAYTGTYAGLLDWLKAQNFDPLTQSATYYALSDAGSAPEKNQLDIQVTGASRFYLYVPASASKLSFSQVKEKHDARFASPGLTGASEYTVQEFSASRPSELMVRADWITNPQTKAQQKYLQAEALYRNFVYEKYTTVDPALETTIQKMFWQDYAPENDSVYNAVTRIRSVLSRNTVFSYEAPTSAYTGTDILRAFLSGRESGNAVLYATAAVEALRSRGIPARYLEGYYVPTQENTEAVRSLTGQNAHAWAEVYFDGIGWLPVDVTPGYYYDAVTLQQMIALPDTVRKTAALENDESGKNEVAKDKNGSQAMPDPLTTATNLVLIFLGIIALLFILLAVLLILLELIRFFGERRRKAEFYSAPPQKQIRMAKDHIFLLLSLWGIHASLGWKTQLVDKKLAKRFPDIAPGDYSRVVSPLEKSIYGGIELKPFERRTISVLIHKLSTVSLHANRWMYWKIRYSFLLSAMPWHKPAKKKKTNRQKKHS